MCRMQTAVRLAPSDHLVSHDNLHIVPLGASHVQCAVIAQMVSYDLGESVTCWLL